MRSAIGCFLVLLAMCGGHVPGTSRAMEVEAEKPEGHIATSGPKAPLSAAQRAALEAKRATTVVPARAAEPIKTKSAEVSTIPANTGAPGLKAPPAATLVQPSDSPRTPVPHGVRRAEEEAAIAAFLAALGSDIGRQAGLVKSPHGGAVPTIAYPPAAGGGR